jgi:hypothetical protein
MYINMIVHFNVEHESNEVMELNVLALKRANPGYHD